MHHTTNPKLPRSQIRGRQQGFSVIELMIVLAVAGMLIVGALVAGTTVMSGVKSNRYVTKIVAIATQARGWKGIKTTYEGLSLTDLVNMGRVPDVNTPDGGEFSAAEDDDDNSQFNIAATYMPEAICLDAAAQLLPQAVSAVCTDENDSKTLTVKFD